ncbi:hypothetical protein LXL04_000853 [Taraxacum kok-saghyz]
MEEKINPNEVKSEKNPDLQRRAIAATLLAATIGNSGDAFNRAPLWTVDRLQKSPAKINPKSFTEIQEREREREREREKELGSFENSYIPENTRTPPISYISQTVITFKKPTSGLFKTYLSNMHMCNFFLHICKLFEKKIAFSEFFFATGLVFERFLAIRSRFFEKVNDLAMDRVLTLTRSKPVKKLWVWIISGSFDNSYIPENPRTPKPLDFSKNRLRGAKNRSNTSLVAKKIPKKPLFFSKTLDKCKKKCTCARFQFCFLAYMNISSFCLKNAQIPKIRIIMIMNVLEGPEVGFLKGITVWEIYEIGGVLGSGGLSTKFQKGNTPKQNPMVLADSSDENESNDLMNYHPRQDLRQDPERVVLRIHRSILIRILRMIPRRILDLKYN